MSLGIPALVSRRYAEFTTNGDPLWVTAANFSASGPFDIVDPRTGLVEVGFAAVPPSYDEQSGRTDNVITEVAVAEGKWRQLDLDPGRYWLWFSTTAEVVIRSCDMGVISDPLPAS